MFNLRGVFIKIWCTRGCVSPSRAQRTREPILFKIGRGGGEGEVLYALFHRKISRSNYK